MLLALKLSPEFILFAYNRNLEKHLKMQEITKEYKIKNIITMRQVVSPCDELHMTKSLFHWIARL